MEQNVTNEALLADMRTLNQEHVSAGYPCVQTWQIDRLIEMVDLRGQEADTLHAAVVEYRKEARIMRVALETIASTTGLDDPCRKHVCTARLALSTIGVTVAGKLPNNIKYSGGKRPSFSCLPIDFGRVFKIFMTKEVGGQYYYALQSEDGLKWIRQCHTEEVRPFLVLNKDDAKTLAESILNT